MSGFLGLIATRLSSVLEVPDAAVPPLERVAW